jgi:hypothetical protein
MAIGRSKATTAKLEAGSESQRRQHNRHDLAAPETRNVDMPEHHSAVGIFDSHLMAEEAVEELLCSGLDSRRLSVVGRERDADQRLVGYYTTGEQTMYWGQRGPVSVGVWGALLGTGLFWVPSMGPLLVAGPLLTRLVSPSEEAAGLKGLSAIGAGLCSLGLPRDSVVKYEMAIRSGTFVLIYHGTFAEVEKSCQVLELAHAVETALHVAEPAVVA